MQYVRYICIRWYAILGCSGIFVCFRRRNSVRVVVGSAAGPQRCRIFLPNTYIVNVYCRRRSPHRCLNKTEIHDKYRPRSEIAFRILHPCFFPESGSTESQTSLVVCASENSTGTDSVSVRLCHTWLYILWYARLVRSCEECFTSCARELWK